jgi:H+/Cl- antiporter ClcA
MNIAEKIALSSIAVVIGGMALVVALIVGVVVGAVLIFLLLFGRLVPARTRSYLLSEIVPWSLVYSGATGLISGAVLWVMWIWLPPRKLSALAAPPASPIALPNKS